MFAAFVANELSPGGYPAIEAQKAQAIDAEPTRCVTGTVGSQGFDLLPTIGLRFIGDCHRSILFRVGRSMKPANDCHLQRRTHNALYTSTCGGARGSRNHFRQGGSLSGWSGCGVEGRAEFAPFIHQRHRASQRNCARKRTFPSARDLALLALQSFGSSPRVSDSWLATAVTTAEVRSWLASTSRLARQTAPASWRRREPARTVCLRAQLSSLWRKSGRHAAEQYRRRLLPAD
jgi:hypothetical protein